MQNTPWWAILLLVMNVILLLIALKLLRSKPETAPPAAQEYRPAPQVVTPPVPVQDIPNRQAIIAAVVAAIAEYEGTDISNLRVVSFQQRRAA